MDLNDYQDRARTTAVYRRECANQGIPPWLYATTKLGGETGEVQDLLAKAVRDDRGQITSERRGAALLELGDVLWYVAMIADDLGIPLEEVAGANLAKLRDRAHRGTIGGSGSSR